MIQIKPDDKKNKLTMQGLLIISANDRINRGTVEAVPEGETDLSIRDEIFYGFDNEIAVELEKETFYFIGKGAIYSKIKDGNLIPLHNVVLLEIDTSNVKPVQKVSSFLVDKEGFKIKVDTNEVEFDQAPKQGVVAFIGNITNYPNEQNLQSGDKVYHHHLASNEQFKVVFNDKIYYRQDYNEIFAVERDGVISPLGRYVLIKPEFDNETKTGIIKSIKPKTSIGTIKYASQYATESGFIEGSKVRYIDRAKYEIVINGELLYKTRIDNIFTCSNKAIEIAPI